MSMETSLVCLAGDRGAEPEAVRLSDAMPQVRGEVVRIAAGFCRLSVEIDTVHLAEQSRQLPSLWAIEHPQRVEGRRLEQG